MADSQMLPSLKQAESENISPPDCTVDSYDDRTSINLVRERVWRRIDFFVLPVVIMFQILSLLDRTNLANARVAGLQEDLKLSNYQYTITLTIAFVPFIVAELPMNLALRAVGPNLMLPAMLTLWGIVTTFQGLVKGYSDLLACRFFLGLFEGGVFSGIILYLSFWYPRRHLQWRISAFLVIANLGGAFSGLLSYGIIRMDGLGSRPGWAWIFILEGLFTIVFGISAFYTLPRSPAHARFLNKIEKDYVIFRLHQTGAIDRDDDADAFSWREVRQAFTLPQVWFLSVILFFGGAISFGLVYFTPSIVAGLGYTRAEAQLYSVPPTVVSFFEVSMVSAYISDRLGARGLVIMFSALLMTTGFVIFLVSESLHIKYGSLFLIVTGNQSASPALLTWNANNASPYTRRATATAVGSVMTNSGGILATWLLGTLSPAPLYTKATITFLIFAILIFVLSGVNIVYLDSQNRRKAAIRATMSREDEKPRLGNQSAWFMYNL